MTLKPYWTDGKATLYHGDCLSVLRSLPSESVQCCVTSPPYFGLRNYGLPPSVWGGVPSCSHEWQDASWRPSRWGEHDDDKLGEKQRTNSGSIGHRGGVKSQSVCGKCGAWRGCLGLEPSPEMFVEHLVEVFREVRRVLRSDGTCWVNLGDSYSSQGGGGAAPGKTAIVGNTINGAVGDRAPRIPPVGLKPKDLCGIPWRVAFALQEDGWWLRQDIIWSKLNPMPESVTDRCTKAHEYIFLLSKSARYFYDAEAVKEEAASDWLSRGGSLLNETKWHSSARGDNPSRRSDRSNCDESTRNRRSVWTVATQPYPGAHFATFPPKLIEPCILAGTSAEGACERCGAPWVRVVERTNEPDESAKGSRFDKGKTGINGNGRVQEGERYRKTTTGWRPSCDCNAGKVPCVVLDPFGGSCTTLEVARQNGCRGIAIELNEEYCRLGVERLRQGVLI